MKLNNYNRGGLNATLLMLLAGSAVAQPALVTSPTTLNPGATTITDATTGNAIPLATAQVTVRNTTLTVNGRHNIASLTLENLAVVTHAANTSFDYSGGAGTDVVRGMHIITSGAVTLNSNTRIDANALGHPSDSGTGKGTGGVAYEVAAGASHGGSGGRGSASYGLPMQGPTYGVIAQPVQFGSGGGRDNLSLGGAGGGCIRLAVGTTLTLTNGTIRASGAAADGHEAGGGAGGSIWISAPTISGSGTIITDGGTGNGAFAGGGGGGRIAVTSSSSIPVGVVRQSRGGSGVERGGAGSMYIKIGSQPATVTFDNGGLVGGYTELTSERTFDNLVVTGRAMLTHPALQTGFAIVANNSVQFDTNSGIDVSYRGNVSDTGTAPGTGNIALDVAAGGGHGGNGGDGSASFGIISGGGTYGSVASPTAFGSGGGRDNLQLGGSGGGAVKLTVNGVFTHNGFVRANGSNNNGAEAGGGAGGSVWIVTNSIAGTGALEAFGGEGNGAYAGGGGGGRIAITSNSAIPATVTFDASGGTGVEGGGAGSFYSRVGSATSITTYDNKNLSNARTDLATDRTFGHLVITGRALLTHPALQTGFTVTTTGDVTINSNSGFDVSGRGYASDGGPAAGTGGVAYEVASGGGHGGNGGVGDPGFGPNFGGGTYGSVMSPITLGSGGGRDNIDLGGAGGGALRLIVGGALINNGNIRAKGDNSAGHEAGGGAGGSIWITTNSMSGSGVVEADGGQGNGAYAGGGGGGRIAVYSASSIPGSLTFDATGGTGYTFGAPGSVHTKIGTALSTTTFDNRGIASTATDLAGDRNFENLVITGRAVLTHLQLESDVTVHVSNNLQIDGNSGIDLVGRGHPSDQGPGAGTGGVAYEVAGGGGYGGRGGNGSPSFGSPPGGGTYGAISSPLGFGSGGGRDNISLGGAGGGSLQLVVDGTATVNGFIRSPGAPRTGHETGGGSGGGLWVQAGTLAGSGTISARGGDGNGAYSGGGGGGRIGIFSCNVTMPLANITALGGTGVNSGQAGSVFFGSSSITFSEQPVSADYDGGALIQLGVVASSNTPISYRWRKRGSDGNFAELEDNTVYSGADSSTLFIIGAGCQEGGEYDCLACDECGCMPSMSATIYVNATGDYNLDGGVDGSDVDAFFFDWSAGNSGADVNFDGGVDGADVEFFFINWSAGC